MTVDILPRAERIIYWIAGIGSIANALYHLRLESENFQRTPFSENTLTPGWAFLGRKQDLSDVEWGRWRTLTWQLLFFNVLRIIICQSCRAFGFKEQTCKFFILLFDASILNWIMGLRCVLLLLVEAALIYAVSYSNSIWAIWIAILSMTYSLNSHSFMVKKAGYLGLYKRQSDIFYYFTTAEAFVHIGLVSFAIEKIKFKSVHKLSKKTNTSVNKQENDIVQSASQIDMPRKVVKRKRDDSGDVQNDICQRIQRPSDLSSDPSFIDLLYYILCLPKFFDGPIFTYSDFHEQEKAFYERSSPSIPFKDIFKGLFRIAFWALFIEFQCHFFYHSAIGSEAEFVRSMTLTGIIALGYYQGQLFMVKYLCMYGLSCELLRFEGIVPQSSPRCISWVFSYTDMWKYFDVGLYQFIKRYIFIPLGGSHSGFLRQAFASGLVFAFIYFWHGASTALLIWCLGNYAVGLVESLGIKIEKSRMGVYLFHGSSSFWSGLDFTFAFRMQCGFTDVTNIWENSRKRNRNTAIAVCYSLIYHCQHL
ncbi:uncharacterized protein LOC101854417 isoform X2 [Aplysia californica]|uniref:Uncharacterized protein LOC101854417 isoform X2 n=1 Tax=Aplysia californica TaxID=6500 RepID=A0ABM1VV36_APLCA|nr:uncharacterized protein LOC101854417 isoform X2 [Aplysia californica]